MRTKLAQLTFDYDGQPVVIRPTQGLRLGTIVREGHPFLKAHPELFEPLALEPEYDHLASWAENAQLGNSRPSAGPA